MRTKTGPISGEASGSRNGLVRRRLTALAVVAAMLVLGGSALVGVEAQASAVKQPGYTITDLGTLPGDTVSAGFGINDAGQAVGYSAGDDSAGSGQPVLFSGGTVIPLDPLSALFGFGGFGAALAINGSGEAVGYSANFWTEATSWAGGSAADLGALPSNPPPRESIAYGVDSTGQAVGYSQSDVKDLAPRPEGSIAVLFSGGSATSLGTLAGDTQSVAYSINASGQVVGYSQGASRQHAVLFTGGSFSDLGALPGDLNSAAFAINDAGQAVGYSGGVDGMRAALFVLGGVSDLGVLPGDTNSQALAIDSGGDAVGSSDRDGFHEHAVIFHQGRVIALDSLLPAGSGWTLQTASGINNSGQIVGQGSHDGQLRAFLLTPPPSGSAAALAGASSKPIVDPLIPAGPVGPPGSQTGPVPNITDPHPPKIYVHYDYMVMPGPKGHSDAPPPNAIRAVVASFANHGIQLVVDPKHVAIPERTVLAFHSPLDPAVAGPDAVDFFALKNSYFEASHPGEHYAIFSYYSVCDTDDRCIDASHDASIDCPFVGQAGCGEIVGQNFIVSLGASVFVAHAPSTSLFLLNGGTFMHELGHNLGLHHGGGIGPEPCIPPTCEDRPGYKPNYLSVMNYRYQTTGISSADTVGSNVADPALTRLDYSGQVLPTGGPTPGVLKELNGLDEPSGLGSGTADLFRYSDAAACAGHSSAPTNGPVDWNGDGDTTDTGVTADTNIADHNNVCGTFVNLNGHNDWADLLASLTGSASAKAAKAAAVFAVEP
jgi:probable HAF family extracellular repeat protein